MSNKRYGIVACSKCKRAWGIKLSQKQTICPQCRKKYNILNLKILYKTSNLKELQLYIAKFQEKLFSKNLFKQYY
jgi:hypothetical protein